MLIKLEYDGTKKNRKDPDIANKYLISYHQEEELIKVILFIWAHYRRRIYLCKS